MSAGPMVARGCGGDLRGASGVRHAEGFETFDRPPRSVAFVTPGRIVALGDRVSRVFPLVGSACRGDGRLTLVGSIDYQFSF
jgi:hypothetical protein